MPQVHRLASARKLTVRPLSLALDGRTPRHWMDGDPFETHLMNAFSLVFPSGERFFMRSVRALRQHVKSAALQQQVNDFLAQEAFHSREHHAFNLWLKQFKLPITGIERVAEEITVRDEGRRTPIQNLALTAALEHFTAVMAKFLLTHPEFLARIHPTLQPLWLWHAVEELDHKAVAFDVFEAAGGTYATRATWMLAAMVGMVTSSLYLQWHLMRRDGQATNVRSYARGLWRYLGPKGHVVELMPELLRYFRPDFHPWESDDTALLAHAEALLRALRGESDAA
jgi:predicted metal-dependent hydrolase